MEPEGYNQNDEQRNRTEERVRKLFTFLTVVRFPFDEMLTIGNGLSDHLAEPPITENHHEDGDNKADFPSGERRSSQGLDRNPVLDFRRTRRCHRERCRTE